MTLQQLIEEAKKEFERKWQYDEFTYESTGFFDMDKATDFLEAKMKEAYREGAKGMKDAMKDMDISDPSLKTAMQNKVLEQAEAFLSTLNT